MVPTWTLKWQTANSVQVQATTNFSGPPSDLLDWSFQRLVPILWFDIWISTIRISSSKLVLFWGFWLLWSIADVSAPLPLNSWRRSTWPFSMNFYFQGNLTIPSRKTPSIANSHHRVTDGSSMSSSDKLKCIRRSISKGGEWSELVLYQLPGPMIDYLNISHFHLIYQIGPDSTLRDLYFFFF